MLFIIKAFYLSLLVHIDKDNIDNFLQKNEAYI